MKKREQALFVVELANAVTNEVLTQIEDGRTDETWDGQDLRDLLAEGFCSAAQQQHRMGPPQRSQNGLPALRAATTRCGGAEMSKITHAASYDYPAGGRYNETTATLEDGRKAWINTQYATVDVLHTNGCVISLQTACYPKAKCDCGAMADIDVAALIADARTNGKFGRKPEPKPEPKPETEPEPSRNGLCPKCGTYCFGDCEAYG